MKLITFVVPCYNSAAYMERCIRSLLPAGEEAEIILVNDGSTDETGSICDEYASIYPTIIKAVHQPNGGHGEGVNTGLRHAAGLYFKVVDSDDWADETSLKDVMNLLRKFTKIPLDLLICNYVYNCEDADYKKTIKYTNVFPQNKIFDWGDTRRFRITQYLLMHSAFYRTALLRDCNVILPKHTFYVDNLFVYYPLPYVKSMYYLNVDFYQYCIGRPDQSVNERIMVSRVDQQIRITKMLIAAHDLQALRKSNPKLVRYMVSLLSMMMCVSSVLLIIEGSAESRIKRKKLWAHIKEVNSSLCSKLRYTSLATITIMPGYFGENLCLILYRIARKIFRFN